MAAVTVSICGPLPSGGFDVHAIGCRDLRQPKYRGIRPGTWKATVTTVEQVVTEIYQDIMRDAEYEDGVSADWSDYADDVHILPCVGRLA